MNEEFKAKWIQELRSGKYKQGTGHLKQSTSELGDEYCCLGVACEVLGANWIPRRLLAFGDDVTDYATTHPYYQEGLDTFEGQLPTTLLDELELTDEQQDALVNMNDEQMLSFNEIADYIETL